MLDQKPVVFFHVMKCGGTSVRAGLSTSAARARQAAIAEETAAAPTAAGSAPASEVAPKRERPAIFELDERVAKAAAGGTDRDNWVFRDALLPYVLSAEQPALVLGHFRYRDRYAALGSTTHFVTVLREPVDRLVSLYKYRRYKEGVDVPVSMPFDAYLADKRWAKEGHAYVDTFCGSVDLDPRSDEAIAATVRNLRRFTVVGFTDRLDAFSTQVSECLGATVTIHKYNTSPAPEDVEIDAGAIEQARSVCAPDIRVYEALST